MQTYELYDKVFRCEFRLYIGAFDDFKDAIRHMNGYPGDEDLAPAAGYCIALGGAVAVWLPEFSAGNPRNLGTMAHELMHAVHIRLWRDCDVQYWKGSAEVGAYYLEFLMNGFLEQIGRAEADNPPFAST